MAAACRALSAWDWSAWAIASDITSDITSGTASDITSDIAGGSASGRHGVAAVGSWPRSSSRRASRIAAAGANGSRLRPLIVQFTRAANVKVPATQSSSSRLAGSRRR